MVLHVKVIPLIFAIYRWIRMSLNVLKDKSLKSYFFEKKLTLNTQRERELAANQAEPEKSRLSLYLVLTLTKIC